MPPPDNGFDAPAMIAALERGRIVIETKFLAGGDVLEQAIAGIAAMTADLDDLTAAIGPAAIATTTTQLGAAAATLRALPAQQATRRAALETLAARRTALACHIAEMRGSLAYMWAFAMNIKITARTIEGHETGLDAFAQDISDRIDAGRAEIGALETALAAMQAELAAALQRAAALEANCAATIPAVPDRLAAAAARMGEHRGEIAAAVAEAATLASDIRRKIHRILSALQVGDSTRQRIEHVQAGLAMLAAPAAASPPIAPLRAAMAALLAAQLEATRSEFDARAAEILTGLQSLSQDAEDLQKLRERAAGQDSHSGAGLLRTLEAMVEEAMALATSIETAAARAGETGYAAGEAAGALTQKFEAIQSIQSDVLFMALNTTLKSARIGDAGRPLRIIANELRAHADELDASATACVAVLTTIADAAAQLSGTTAPADSDTSQAHAAATLNAAMRRLRDGGDLNDRNAAAFAAHGKTLIALLTQSAAALDLRNETAAALTDTANALLEIAASCPSAALPDEQIAQLHQLRALYTMAQERTVHDTMLAAHGIAPPADPAPIPADEESALF